jgi:branched-chain amino acid transport system substrate-binding protein
MVTNYGPGIDSEVAFQNAFKAAGGTVTGGVRFPVANPDFSSFAQQLKDSQAESAFLFVQGGDQPAAVGKALAEHGVTTKTTKLFSSGELVNDEPLKSMGEGALGIISGWHYSWVHKSPENAKFVKGINEMLNGRNPDQFTVSGYDGMALIYKALEKTKGKADGDTLIAAMKGLSWESPRGPVSIDPETRDIIQTIYLRRVEKVNGKIQNVEFDKLEKVKDPVKAELKAAGKLNPDGTMK